MLSAVYYTAAWCVPCRTFKPLAVALFTEFGIPLEIQDVDKGDPDVIHSKHIASVPTILFSNGERIVGNWPEAKLREKLSYLTTGDDGH